MPPPAARFRDRADAGKELARALTAYAGRGDVVVLALPRGGVPVAYEVARVLHAPLDVYGVRKLGVPGHEELAMGAVAADGSSVRDEGVIEMCNISSEEFDEVRGREMRELLRREALYRPQRPLPSVTDRVAIVVDDGLATGATMRAAILALRAQHPRRIVAAAPVAPAETVAELGRIADEVTITFVPSFFRAVGLHYDDFTQTSDDDVRRLLERAASDARHSQPA